MAGKRGGQARIPENANHQTGLRPKNAAAMLAARPGSSSQEWRGL
jgi:hypothetical protein